MRCSIRRFLPIALVLVVAQPGMGQDQPGPGAIGAGVLKLFLDVPLKPLDPIEVAGLPPGNRPAVLTWQRVQQLALLRVRAPEATLRSELEPNWLVDEIERFGLDDFTRFRADFLADTLKSPTYQDPTADFLNLQAQLWEVESARRLLAQHERWSQVLRELINGEASGLGLIDLDQTDASLYEVRRQYVHAVGRYRDLLDEFKVALGLSPHALAVVDRSSLAAFDSGFTALDNWFLSPERNLANLDWLIHGLPELGTVTLDGQPVLDDLINNPDRLNAVLDQATRLALQHQPKENGSADQVELRVRSRVRHLLETQIDYQLDLRALVLAARLLDGSVEQLIAPQPSVGVTVSPRPGQAVPLFLANARQFTATHDRIVRRWTSFRAERLALQRDLGLFPATDWASFFDQFTARQSTPLVEAPSRVVPAPPSPPTVAPSPPTNPAPPPPPLPNPVSPPR